MLLEALVSFGCLMGTSYSCEKTLVAYGKQTGYSDVIEAYSERMVTNASPLLRIFGGAVGAVANRRVEIGLTRHISVITTADKANVSYRFEF